MLLLIFKGMRRYRFLFIVILILGLVQGCTKNDAGKDLTQLTIGTRSLGNFTPSTLISYKRLEGYIVQLSSDTITFTILLPELKTGDYSITNEALSEGKAFFNIDFKQSSYSASSGSISITDTSNNSISGIYSVTNASKGFGDPLKISNGKFTKAQIGSFAYSSVEDYEHNQYKTVEIGTQTWMAQNLKSRIYANGDSIREVYRYSDSDSLTNIYGLYYTWNSATHNSDIEMTQGACPQGWHLPSNTEWQQLLSNLGGELVAGGKLKSLISWNVANVGADNSSGFSALGAGMHHPVVEYPDLSERMGYQTFFWSSTFDTTIFDISTAWSLSIDNATRSVLRSPYYRTDMGFSVRCIKN
jgi:uncharacterized protein (TIGR02145 family)